MCYLDACMTSHHAKAAPGMSGAQSPAWMQVAGHYGALGRRQDIAAERAGGAGAWLTRSITVPEHTRDWRERARAAGQVPATKGMRLRGGLTLNGAPRAGSAVRQAYVQQEDMFYAQLTVR